MNIMRYANKKFTERKFENLHKEYLVFLKKENSSKSELDSEI